MDVKSSEDTSFVALMGEREQFIHSLRMAGWTQIEAEYEWDVRQSQADATPDPGDVTEEQQ
jgi:hypothetical protein